MSETNNQVLLDALIKFQRWSEAGGPLLYSENESLRSQLAAERQLKEAAEELAAGLVEAAKWGNDALRSWSTYASFSNLSAEGKKWWYQRYMETDELLAPAAEEGAHQRTSPMTTENSDGRWEKEINSLIGDYQASLNRGACKGDTGEGILRLVVMHLSKIRERLTSGDAAQREE
jgi:hypothetical protein